MTDGIKLRCLNPNQRIEIYKSPKLVSVTTKEGSSVIDYIEMSFDEAIKLRDFFNEFIEANNE